MVYEINYHLKGKSVITITEASLDDVISISSSDPKMMIATNLKHIIDMFQKEHEIAKNEGRSSSNNFQSAKENI